LLKPQDYESAANSKDTQLYTYKQGPCRYLKLLEVSTSDGVDGRHSPFDLIQGLPPKHTSSVEAKLHITTGSANLQQRDDHSKIRLR
jgi:hypothetical protein